MSGRVRKRVGILDHTSIGLGGAQLVNAHMAAALSKDHYVEIVHGGAGYRLAELAQAFDLDLGSTRERIIDGVGDSVGFGVPGSRPAREQVSRAWDLTRQYDVFIYSGMSIPPVCFAKTGLAYVHFPIDSRPDVSVLQGVSWDGRHPVSKWVRASLYQMLWNVQLGRYHRVLANSSFTARWLETRWGCSSQVMYPPVDLDVPSQRKKNMIVSVGRFTGGIRSKHQLEQVQAFRTFVGQGFSNWELCLVGFYRDTPEDRRYLMEVRAAAQGLPVTFVLGGNRNSSAVCLAQARIFWHTAGLGVDQLMYPERAEHFGIATVEAMRAGAIPVVLATGGQPEILDHGSSGFLCESMEDMVRSTVALARDAARCARMSAAAYQRSLAFTGNRFVEQFQNTVSECLSKL